MHPVVEIRHHTHMNNRNANYNKPIKNTISWFFSYYYISVNIRMDDMTICATSHCSFLCPSNNVPAHVKSKYFIRETEKHREKGI